MFGGKKIIIIIYISIADMENYGVSKVLDIYIYIYNGGKGHNAEGRSTVTQQ